MIDATDTALHVLAEAVDQTLKTGGPRAGPAEELFHKAVSAVGRKNEKASLAILRSLVRQSEKRGARYEVEAEAIYERAKVVAGWRPSKRSKRETEKKER